MKTIKQILSLGLCLALICSLLPQVSLTAHAATYSGTCGAEGDGSNLTWTLDTDTGLLTISGSGKMKDYTDVELAPWYDYRDDITSAQLQPGVTSIGSFAFADCFMLCEVEIPEGVTGIGEYAFFLCCDLESIEIPEGVARIETMTFGNSGLKTTSIPGSVTYIGEAAFFSCTDLEQVMIPDGVTVIDNNAFICCSALKQVIIPNSVTHVGLIAFAECSSLTSVFVKNPDCEINEVEGTLGVPGTTHICGAEGSTAQAYAQEYGYAFGHDYVTEITATCTEPGTKTCACAYCGDSSTEEIEALGHDWDEGVVTSEPRYLNPGEKTFTCARCGEIKTEEIARLDNPFEDVKEEDIFFNPVLWALDESVTGGVDETHFAPERTVMRCDAMVFFWAAKGRPEVEVENNSFKDVKAKHWYYNAVMWAYQNGITGGTDATHFSPKQTCSRSEILQFLYAAMGKPEYHIDNPYSDVKNKHWYYDGAIWAYENGLEQGENGKFNAKTPCTRGWVVTYLYRFMTRIELTK